jgi:hypothetical protein
MLGDFNAAGSVPWPTLQTGCITCQQSDNDSHAPLKAQQNAGKNQQPDDVQNDVKRTEGACYRETQSTPLLST